MKTGLKFLLVLAIITACTDNDDVTPRSLSNIDTRGLDRYINVARLLIQQQEPTAVEWDSLFATPYFDILINEQKISTREAEQEDMRLVYKKASHSLEEKEQHSHHFNYKSSLDDLEHYSKEVQAGAVIPKLRDYLWPYLPTRLQSESLIPSIVYTYYIGEEANALPDMILQDALLAYKIDSYAKGILTAHEAFHSITTKSLAQRMKVDLADDDPANYLMTEITGIAQEGIADLIDKDVLGQPQSPVYDLVQLYMTDE